MLVLFKGNGTHKSWRVIRRVTEVVGLSDHTKHGHNETEKNTKIQTQQKRKKRK